MINAFEKQNYLNLETFRRSGLGVRTPVWFVQDVNVLYVRTMANSGKVKRIRNNSEVNIAPCKMDGVLVGGWQPAMAQEVSDPAIDQKVDRLLDKKYGLLNKMLNMTGNSKNRKYAIIQLKVGE